MSLPVLHQLAVTLPYQIDFCSKREEESIQPRIESHNATTQGAHGMSFTKPADSGCAVFSVLINRNRNSLEPERAKKLVVAYYNKD